MNTINDKEFIYTKESAEQTSKTQKEYDFKAGLVDFIDDICCNNMDMMFYDMMPLIRFIKESDSIAYTDPTGRIFLNVPDGVGNNEPIWEFIYDHECLHQIWDTFKVGEKIQREQGSYNHMILNIASDCVINQYLRDIRKKTPFKDGIFPEALKNDYGVEYDPKEDTQYTLYLKLMQSPKVNQLEQLAKDLENKMDPHNKGDQKQPAQQSQGQSQGNDQSDQQGQGQNSQQGGDQGQQSQGQSQGQDKGTGKDGGDHVEDLAQIRKFADSILKKYQNKISGAFGDFIKKCKVSQEMKKDGLAAGTQSRGTSWFSELKVIANSYCRKRLNKFKTYQQTYQVPRRGDVWRPNAPINPGVRVRRDKMDITISFFIDISGSMSGDANINSFNAAHNIGEILKKAFGRDKNVDKVVPTVWGFDHKGLKPCKWGGKLNADGGTPSMEELLQMIIDKSATDLINIVITDGEFNEGYNVKKYLDKMDGLFIFITNQPNASMEQAAKQNKDKMVYLEADKEFILK